MTPDTQGKSHLPGIYRRHRTAGQQDGKSALVRIQGSRDSHQDP